MVEFGEGGILLLDDVVTASMGTDFDRVWNFSHVSLSTYLEDGF